MYYKQNHLRPTPAKSQLTAFHVKNRQADRKLNFNWNGTKLDHTHSPVYLGITLDRSLTYRNHCCPVWARSTHRKLVDTTLNETCRLITGCIRPTATPDIYVLSGIAPPEISSSLRPQPKRAHQTTDKPATQPRSPPARERPPTLAQEFRLNLPASPV